MANSKERIFNGHEKQEDRVRRGAQEREELRAMHDTISVGLSISFG